MLTNGTEATVPSAIPAGTGLEYYRNVTLMPDERELAAAAEEAAVERDSDDDLSGEDIREERMTT